MAVIKFELGRVHFLANALGTSTELRRNRQKLATLIRVLPVAGQTGKTAEVVPFLAEMVYRHRHEDAWMEFLVIAYVQEAPRG